MYGADVGFVNSGGLRTDFAVDDEKGERAITRSDVYTMFPFDNQVYLFELTWEDLLTTLEYSLTGNGKTLLSEVSGITCYYEGSRVNAIVNSDGVAVYANGAWRNGWRTRKLTVSVQQYIVTTNRVSAGLSNPFCEWLNTGRLLAYDKIDNVSAIEVLEVEAAAHCGYLTIDTAPHFINSAYISEAEQNDTFVLPERIREIGAEAFENIALQAVRIPEGCAFIRAGAFKNCTQLREVWLPRDCDVDPAAFEGCTALTAFYAPARGTSEAFAAAWE